MFTACFSLFYSVLLHNLKLHFPGSLTKIEQQTLKQNFLTILIEIFTHKPLCTNKKESTTLCRILIAEKKKFEILFLGVSAFM